MTWGRCGDKHKKGQGNAARNDRAIFRRKEIGRWKRNRANGPNRGRAGGPGEDLRTERD